MIFRGVVFVVGVVVVGFVGFLLVLRLLGLFRRLLPLWGWWRRGLHGLLGIRRRQLQSTRGDHQTHGHLQVFGFHAVATAEGGMGAGDAHGIELTAVALHAAAQGFVHQIRDLLAGDLHIRQPLACQ